MSPRSRPANGPASSIPSSITRMPESGPGALAFFVIGALAGIALPRRPAAVDVEDVPSDQRRLIGGQVDNGSDHVGGRPDAADRQAPQDLRAERLVLEHRTGEGGLDEGRRDRVDYDSRWRPLDRERRDQAIDRVLARAVRGPAGKADLAHLRRDRDDPPATPPPFDRRLHSSARAARDPRAA